MRTPSLALIFGAGLLAACEAAARTANPPPTARVYVSNEDGGSISVIDTRDDAVVATIDVGKRPRGLRVARDGATLYVALSGSPKAPPGVDPATLPPADRAADGIGVVDLESLRLVRVLDSGQDPESFDLVADDRALVVSNEETAEVSIVELATGQVRVRVPVGGEPEGVTTHPDGDVVYVTSEEDHRVDVIDPVAGRRVASVPTGQRPRSIVFTADGARAYVTDELSASVTVIDARRHERVATIAVPREGSGPTGPRPMGAALSRDGSRLYVTGGRGGAIAVIDVESNRVVRTIREVGSRPWGIGVAPDGRLYTANGPGHDVSIVEPETGKVIGRIAVGRSPWGVAVHP
jgi:YVTN family beta-propeller protein